MVSDKIFPPRRGQFTTLMTLTAMVLTSGWLFAAPPRITAKASAGRIGTNETITLEITIEGSGAMGADVAARPASADFRLVGGPSTSSQFALINGSASIRKVIAFEFFPLRTGKLNLPPIQLTADAKTYVTDPIPVEVIPDAAGAPSAQSSPAQPQSFDPYAAGSPQSTSTEPADDVFLQLESSAKNVYVGQSVTLTLLLYLRIPVTGAKMEKEGSFSGFWVEDVELTAAEKTPTPRQVNGKVYQVIAMQRWLLFPLKPGSFSIGPWIYRLQVQTPPRGLFDFGGVRQVIRRSETVGIQVQDFPAQGRPPGFAGWCGDFTLSTAIDRRILRTSEAASLRVSVAGQGNFRGSPAPQLPPIPGCNVFPPKVSEDLHSTLTSLSGSRVWEYVLVPTTRGSLRIPPVELPFFNPVDGLYHVAASPPLELDVQPALGGGAPQSAATAGQPIELKGSDIRYIHTGPGIAVNSARPIYRQTWFAMVLAVMIVITLGAVLWQQWRRRVRQDNRKWAKRLTRNRARHGLAICAGLARKHQVDSFYQALHNVWQDYLEERFSINRISLASSSMGDTLTAAGANPATAEEAGSILRECEVRRFAPNNATVADLSALLNRADDIFARLEKECP